MFYKIYAGNPSDPIYVSFIEYHVLFCYNPILLEQLEFRPELFLYFVWATFIKDVSLFFWFFKPSSFPVCVLPIPYSITVTRLPLPPRERTSYMNIVLVLFWEKGKFPNLILIRWNSSRKDVFFFEEDVKIQLIFS